MHIRVNIPCWGLNEYISGIRAIFLLHSSHFLEELLTEIKSCVGVKNVYLVSSARHGLFLAIKHLKLEGKRIAIPGYVCPDIFSAIERAKAKPVPIDVDKDSICFDISKLSDSVQKNEIDGILAPNTYGLDQDFEALVRFGVPVIEDAAYQAGLSSKQQDQPCGLRADAGVWSFNFKALTSIGGGILFASDELECPFTAGIRRAEFNELKLYFNRTIRSILRHYIPTFLPGATQPRLNQSLEIRNPALDFDEKPMSSLQAAIALAQWRKRNNIYKHQLQNIKQLGEIVSLCESVKLLHPTQDKLTRHVLPLILCVRQEDSRAAQYRFRQILHRHSVQTKPIYPIVLGSPDRLPNSYHLADKILLIPCNESLSPQKIALIGKAIQNASDIILEEFGKEVK